MRRKPPVPPLTALLLASLTWAATVCAQIPAAPTSGVRNYEINGMADQPFTVQVLDAHRTVDNTLLVRLTMINRGTAPLQAGYQFAEAASPADAQKISGVYAVDPNGEIKYPVLRNKQGVAICSRIDPPLQPGERRNLFTQLAPPPDTSPTVSIFIPGAGRIERVPIGLPAAGESIPPGAPVGGPGNYPGPANPVPPAPQANVDERTTNISPNFVTDQPGSTPAASSDKGIGTIQDGNSVVPFTVEALSLRRQPDGNMKLRLAFTNHSSGPLNVDGQFTGSLGNLAGGQQISGVYLLDPVSQARFDVLRPTELTALCSSLSPPLAPGERRDLAAEFADLPPAVRTVEVHFPHASTIGGVPVER